MTLAVGNPGRGLGQSQLCGGVNALKRIYKIIINVGYIWHWHGHIDINLYVLIATRKRGDGRSGKILFLIVVNKQLL